jgi:hypothetical protein
LNPGFLYSFPQIYHLEVTVKFLTDIALLEIVMEELLSFNFPSERKKHVTPSRKPMKNFLQPKNSFNQSQNSFHSKIEILFKEFFFFLPSSTFSFFVFFKFILTIILTSHKNCTMMYHLRSILIISEIDKNKLNLISYVK